MKVSPEPGPEEAAAIVAALEALRESEPGEDNLLRDRWRLAGLLGHAPPREMKLCGSLWSHPSWEGTV